MNDIIDDIVLREVQKGVTFYELLGKVASALNLPLDTRQNKDTVIKAVNNSKRRLKRRGELLTIIPTMFAHCKNPHKANKAFIELCEDVYFMIEQQMDSMIENYYFPDAPRAAILTDMKKKLSIGTGMTLGSPSHVFESNAKAVELLEKDDEQ